LNKKYVNVTIIIIIISAILVVFYMNQTDQTDINERTKKLVEEAVALIGEKGEATFSELRNEETKWFTNDTYVFVWKIDGIRVVYPPDQKSEGQNMSNLIDATGKEIGRLFIEIALSEDGEGWIDYKWPKPGESDPSNKKTFIKLATYGENSFLVGSGFYVDTK